MQQDGSTIAKPRRGLTDRGERPENKARGLNPDDGSDHREVMKSGYTAIEEHCHELAAEKLSP